MKEAVRALLEQIIDYAGLFPPAKLPMEEAVRIYLHEKKTSSYAWMLGRFVCPTTRLSELLAMAKGHPNASMLTVTALGQQSSAAKDVQTGIDADLRLIEDFRTAWGNREVIDMYEVALPKGVPLAPLATLLIPEASAFQAGGIRGFVEISHTPRWRQDIEDCALLLHQMRYAPGNATFGMKLRCGGLAVEAFPDEQEIANFIGHAWNWKIPWKATAGLHHPRRHWDKSLQLWHHGFVNVFVAGILVWAHSLSEANIFEILADREGKHFRFENDSVAWKEWSCTTSQITNARANFATSFGCCSFAEPIEDLLAMGLLDPSTSPSPPAPLPLRDEGSQGA